jgi:hypothetical protein
MTENLIPDNFHKSAERCMGHRKIYLWPYVNKALLLMNMDKNRNFSTTSDVILSC